MNCYYCLLATKKEKSKNSHCPECGIPIAKLTTNNTKLKKEPTLIDTSYFISKIHIINNMRERYVDQLQDMNELKKDNIRKSRKNNLDEFFSEGTFALAMLSIGRKFSVIDGNASYDAIEILNGATTQIKSTWIDVYQQKKTVDASTFTTWDYYKPVNFLHFLQFDPHRLEYFDLYEIDWIKYVEDEYLNAVKSDKQRPRISVMKRIIQPNNLQPIKRFYWSEINEI